MLGFLLLFCNFVCLFVWFLEERVVFLKEKKTHKFSFLVASQMFC